MILLGYPSLLLLAGTANFILIAFGGFLMYGISAMAAGATPVKAPETDLKADVQNLLAAVTDKTRLVFVANPNNPTGTYLTEDEMAEYQAFSELCLDQDAVSLVEYAQDLLAQGCDINLTPENGRRLQNGRMAGKKKQRHGFLIGCQNPVLNCLRRCVLSTISGMRFPIFSPVKTVKKKTLWKHLWSRFFMTLKIRKRFRAMIWL